MSVHVQTGYGYEVRWRVDKIDSRTGVLTRICDYPQNKNLVVSGGIGWRYYNQDEFVNPTLETFVFGFVAVGTGDTTPLSSDSTLEAEYAYVAAPESFGRLEHNSSALGAQADLSTYHVDTSDPNKPFVIIGVEFGLNDCVDDALAECGLFTAGTGGTMFSRNLFRDNAGNKMTIDKSHHDYLRVYAKVTVMRVESQNNTYWERTRTGYTVRGIITDVGLARCLDQGHWDANMMDPAGPINFGDNTPDPTDPDHADTGLNGTTLGLAVTGTWDAASYTARTIACVCPFDEGGAAPGLTIKEAVPVSGNTDATCAWRMTFTKAVDLGIIKLDTNMLMMDITYTIAAVTPDE
jgi:hypothetical protein